MCDTAGRGVEVQLLVSGPHVERPSAHLRGERGYQPLLDAGVQIWRYRPSLLHAQVITVDGDLVMVGTADLDIRSLALDERVALVLYAPAVTAELDARSDEDLTVSAWVGAGHRAADDRRRASRVTGRHRDPPWMTFR